MNEADRRWTRRLKMAVAIFLTIVSGAALAFTSCALAFDKTFSTTAHIPTPPLFAAGMILGALMFVGGVIWMVVAAIMLLVNLFRDRWDGFN